MTMQIRRRIGTPGAPTATDLVVGQLGYHDPGGATPDRQLWIGDGTAVQLLVGGTRQVEIATAQTITGAKTIAVSNFHLTGGSANNILTTDGTGGLSWTAAPAGGLLTVSTDGITIDGDGTSADPLSVIRLPTARNIALQGNGTTTTITSTAAAFDGSANVTISNISVSLDDGVY